MYPGHEPLLNLLAASDEDLALHASRESAAFAELYHRHFQRVYRYLLAVSRNVTDAQDLTAQTFLSALEGITSFRGEARFSTWLLAIARNKAAMLFRSRRRETSLEDSIDLPDSSPLPEFAAGQNVQLNMALQALKKLAPERAEAIMLYIFADLSAAEAGSLMNKSQAAVKMLVLRGLRELRTMLVHHQEVI